MGIETVNVSGLWNNPGEALCMACKDSGMNRDRPDALLIGIEGLACSMPRPV